jgi:hypothetical protein
MPVEIARSGAMLADTMTPIRRAALALCAVLALVGSAGLPAIANAELSASGGIQEYINKAQQQQETTATTATVASEKETASSSISSSLVLLAVAAAALLLGGVAFVIIRDARSIAPVAEGSASGTGSRNAEDQLRRRRAKAKAAKQQRKRNR